MLIGHSKGLFVIQIITDRKQLNSRFYHYSDVVSMYNKNFNKIIEMGVEYLKLCIPNEYQMLYSLSHILLRVLD